MRWFLTTYEQYKNLISQLQQQITNFKFIYPFKLIMVQVYLPIQINIWIIFRYSNHMCTWPDNHQGKYFNLSKECYAVSTQLEPTFCKS